MYTAKIKSFWTAIAVMLLLSPLLLAKADQLLPLSNKTLCSLSEVGSTGTLSNYIHIMALLANNDIQITAKAPRTSDRDSTTIDEIHIRATSSSEGAPSAPEFSAAQNALEPDLFKRVDYGKPARLTGPCLEIACEEDVVRGSSYCGVVVVLCTAGSTRIVNPVQPVAGGEPCSYVNDNTAATGIRSSCLIIEMAAQLKLVQNQWIVYDSISTVTVPVTVVTQTQPLSTISILYAGSVSTIAPQYEHFVNAASSVIAANGGGLVTTTVNSGAASTTSRPSISTSSPSTNSRMFISSAAVPTTDSPSSAMSMAAGSTITPTPGISTVSTIRGSASVSSSSPVAVAGAGKAECMIIALYAVAGAAILAIGCL